MAATSVSLVEPYPHWQETHRHGNQALLSDHDAKKTATHWQDHRGQVAPQPCTTQTRRQEERQDTQHTRRPTEPHKSEREEPSVR